jgi:hypothetical protein
MQVRRGSSGGGRRSHVVGDPAQRVFRAARHGAAPARGRGPHAARGRVRSQRRPRPLPAIHAPNPYRCYPSPLRQSLTARRGPSPNPAPARLAPASLRTARRLAWRSLPGLPPRRAPRRTRRARSAPRRAVPGARCSIARAQAHCPAPCAAGDKVRMRRAWAGRGPGRRRACLRLAAAPRLTAAPAAPTPRSPTPAAPRRARRRCRRGARRRHTAACATRSAGCRAC